MALSPLRVPTAVLGIGQSFVTWRERRRDGRVAEARVALVQDGPEGLEQAVLAARAQAGARARRFVLAVAHPYAVQRLLTLPELTRAEVRQVLERKARALLGTDESVPFAARELAPLADGAQARSAWLLAGVRPAIKDLRIRLRNHGLHADRVVSLELAALERARHEAAPDRAAILIVVGEASVHVALTRDASLVYLESIAGDLSSRPDLAAGLVHEIKTCAGFWRKESRGDSVGQVVVAGLPQERLDLLTLNLAAMLPGATVRAVLATATEQAQALVVGEPAFLEVAGVRGPLSVELSFGLPFGRLRLGLATAAGALLTLAFAWSVLQHASRELEEIRQRTGMLRRSAADLEELQARERASEATLARAEAYLQRGMAISRHGLPAERILEEVLGAFAGRAEFDGLSLSRGEDSSARFRASGRCASTATTLVARLRVVLDRLAASEWIRDVSLSLPGELAGTGSETAFAVEGRVES